jgi:type IV pilus assembly protein PilW
MKSFQLKKISRRNFQKGMNMVEIMIALAISAVLVAGILKIFTSNKATYHTMSAQAGLQENARFALMLIGKAVRGADNWGCLANRSLITGTVYSAGLSGIDGANDSITAAGTFGKTSPVTAASGSNIIVSNSSGYKIGDDILISNCQYGQIVTIGSGFVTNAITIPLTSALDRSYTTDASIQKLQTNSYSVATGASGLPTLMLNDGDGFIYELIEGVDGMSITYGEDNDGDGIANYFVPASSVADMDNIKAVKISLLMATIDEVTSKSKSLTFNGTTYTDRRIRKVFNTTLALRNRLQ